MLDKPYEDSDREEVNGSLIKSNNVPQIRNTSIPFSSLPHYSIINIILENHKISSLDSGAETNVFVTHPSSKVINNLNHSNNNGYIRRDSIGSCLPDIPGEIRYQDSDKKMIRKSFDLVFKKISIDKLSESISIVNKKLEAKEYDDLNNVIKKLSKPPIQKYSTIDPRSAKKYNENKNNTIKIRPQTQNISVRPPINGAFFTEMQEIKDKMENFNKKLDQLNNINNDQSYYLNSKMNKNNQNEKESKGSRLSHEHPPILSNFYSEYGKVTNDNLLKLTNDKVKNYPSSIHYDQEKNLLAIGLITREVLVFQIHYSY